MIKEYEKNKDGFNVVMKSPLWQMAIVTYENQYDDENKEKIARHMTTDEAFVLVDGTATLYTVDENDCLEGVPLEKNKIYVVEKGTWHSLVLSKDALAVAVENADVRVEDTERRHL